VVGALAVMVLLPCGEIAVRKLFHSGIPASTPLVQHLVLAVAMIGGAIAARENRLLSLSTLTTFLKPAAQRAVSLFAQGFAAAVSLCLARAAWDFVAARQQFSKVVGWGLPDWVFLGLLVLGFAVIAVRLLWHADKSWAGRLGALGLAAALLAFVAWTGIDPAKLRWPALIALLVATAVGAPIFTTLGGAAILLFWSAGEPISSVPLKQAQLTLNPTLPTIPLFTLAGYFLAEGGAARRLVDLFNACFGRWRGGPALIAVVVCAFFTSFTGASGVTILALGGLLMPILLSSGYSERASLGLITGAGSLGLLFPPCLPPILYSIVASGSGTTSVSMEEMFQGGAVPGVLMMVLAGAWGVRCGPRREASAARFDARAAWRAFWRAKWELLLPVVALVALFGGWATPVEAAALTALYAFAVETIVYRDLTLVRDVPRVMTECGLLIGGVLLILGVALGFTHYLIDAQVPDRAVEWVTGAVKSKGVFLLLVNLLLLLVGCLMDIYSAIVVVVPLLAPIAQAFGIDMTHLGVLFLVNLQLGYLTPPVGMNLFLASYRFGKPVVEVARASLPMLLVLLIGVLLVTYVPWLTTWLPQRLK
jgi:tripartite ATP-independent transporter DctM subunit